MAATTVPGRGERGRGPHHLPGSGGPQPPAGEGRCQSLIYRKQVPAPRERTQTLWGGWGRGSLNPPWPADLCPTSPAHGSQGCDGETEARGGAVTYPRLRAALPCSPLPPAPRPRSDARAHVQERGMPLVLSALAPLAEGRTAAHGRWARPSPPLPLVQLCKGGRRCQ